MLDVLGGIAGEAIKNIRTVASMTMEKCVLEHYTAALNQSIS